MSCGAPKSGHVWGAGGATESFLSRYLRADSCDMRQGYVPIGNGAAVA